MSNFVTLYLDAADTHQDEIQDQAGTSIGKLVISCCAAFVLGCIVWLVLYSRCQKSSDKESKSPHSDEEENLK